MLTQDSGLKSQRQFEPVPSDYAILKVHTLPETGGDTIWASAYEAYDRLSPEFAKFLEGLTAKHDANFFHGVATSNGTKLRVDVRGAPQNVGPDLSAVHPGTHCRLSTSGCPHDVDVWLQSSAQTPSQAGRACL